MDHKEVMDKLKELTPQGKITCADARKLAEDLQVERSEIGKACDDAGIKICACDLGCF